MTSSSEGGTISIDDSLAAALRGYIRCRKEHAPLPCFRRDQRGPCVLTDMLAAWKKRHAPTPQTEDPHVAALTQAGCPRNRAKMVLVREGFGMANIDAVVAAHAAQTQAQHEPVPAGVTVCQQCAPGTTTWAWKRGHADVYRGPCHRVTINIAAATQTHASAKEPLPAHRLQNSAAQVLCVGCGGALRFCGAGEFMAVSHVWEHGWQGSAEDGVCSRVLDALLDAAASIGVRWIWLDVALISRDRALRALSVNAMHAVYSTARATLVCDRLLAGMRGGSARERALALAAADWMTRVWTMQEALLSRDVLVAQRGGGTWSTAETLRALVLDDGNDAWTAYGAVQMLFGTVEVVTADPETVLERTVGLGRERTTSKPEDMARALFPLFRLVWPGPGTGLADGQRLLLEHLGPHLAPRCAGLFGPLGLPRPWSWAPVSLAGCSQSLSSRGRAVTPDGLWGYWAWREVRAVSRTPLGAQAQNPQASSAMAGRDPKPHSLQLAELTGGMCDFVDFADLDGKPCLSAMVHYRPEEPFPWAGQRLFLLANALRANDTADGLGGYDLAIVEDSADARYRMHRVASVFGPWIDMAAGRELSIQGILF